MTTNHHKATPRDGPLVVLSGCLYCGFDVKRVPGGHGSTWVHVFTGTVAGSGSPRPVYGESMRDHGGQVTYTPFIGLHGEAGHKAEHDDGRIEWIYLVPSSNDPDEPEAEHPNVFVYIDYARGAFVNAVHHYLMFDGA